MITVCNAYLEHPTDMTYLEDNKPLNCWNQAIHLDATHQVHDFHYSDVIKGAIVSQITSLTIGNSTVYSDAGQRKHQSSAPMAFVRGIHRGPVNSPHKWPVTRRMFPFDDVIMLIALVELR